MLGKLSKKISWLKYEFFPKASDPPPPLTFRIFEALFLEKKNSYLSQLIFFKSFLQSTARLVYSSLFLSILFENKSIYQKAKKIQNKSLERAGRRLGNMRLLCVLLQHKSAKSNIHIYISPFLHFSISLQMDRLPLDILPIKVLSKYFFLV